MGQYAHVRLQLLELADSIRKDSAQVFEMLAARSTTGKALKQKMSRETGLKPSQTMLTTDLPPKDKEGRYMSADRTHPDDILEDGQTLESHAVEEFAQLYIVYLGVFEEDYKGNDLDAIRNSAKRLL